MALDGQQLPEAKGQQKGKHIQTGKGKM